MNKMWIHVNLIEKVWEKGQESNGSCNVFI